MENTWENKTESQVPVIPKSGGISSRESPRKAGSP